MSTVADFYGVPLEGIVQQVDTITLTASPSALSKKGIVSYPSLETAGATPTADVISVYDVTTATPLVLNTDYTLAVSGSAPETLTYSVTWVSSSTASSSGDTCKVTYRWGTVPDTSYSFGEFQGETGAAPAGTAFKGSITDTEGTSASGLGTAMPGGSLTDPAMGSQSSSETGAPGSEYAVTGTVPGTYGAPLGAPDTEGVYGGATLPENFVPTDTSLTGTLDTVAAGGSNLVPAEYSSPPGYRAPSSGVAATSKDTTHTDILGNQLNAPSTPSTTAYAATQADTSYIGATAKPTALASQTDTVTAAQAATRYYLSQQGVVPSSIVVKDTTTPATLVLNTDYAVTTAGNGATTVAYIVLTAGTNFTASDNISITYNFGDATYWDSNVPAAVPGAPTLSSATAVNRGAKVTWAPPSGLTPVDFYLLQAEDTGTMYVPATGQPVLDGQPSPSGGATVGQPTYQADTLVLIAAALATPAAPTVTPTGTAGTTHYSYRIAARNANGTTLAGAEGSTTTGNATLTGVNYNALSWTAVTGAASYDVYGRTASGELFLANVSATTYNDTGADTPAGALPTLNTTLPTTSQLGVLIPPGQVIVRDVTSAAQSILASGEITGGESDPLQADGQVLELGYDYTVTQIGVGPWAQYQIALVASSVNAAAGDSIIVEYWYGADPSSVSAVFTQGLTPNTPVIYKPDGTTYSQHGYRFRVAAGNRLGLGPYSAWSSYVVPLNFNAAQPGHEGSTQDELVLDPANAVNPIYKPDGSIKSGTGLGG
jgi:hypothetical protein